MSAFEAEEEEPQAQATATGLPVQSTEPEDAAAEEPALPVLCAQFRGEVLSLPPFEPTENVRDLKRCLEDRTLVPAQRQKLIGLVKGKLPPDDTLLGSLKLKRPTHKFQLIGTPDEALFVDPADRDDLPEVV